MESVALIGFGEAGSAFTRAGGWSGAGAFDIDPSRTRSATLAEALTGATVVISLVTADAALAVATAAAAYVAPGALFLDMNSVAPGTKCAAARTIDDAGGRYVDVAVMAPVEPARLGAPLLASGPHAVAAAAALADLGFTAVRVVEGDVGRASAIKMIRSVMIKGQEALTAEMMLAADKAGVADEVLASLGPGWRATADYNLKRMAAHGRRRAAEMEQAAQTLESLQVDPVMTRGTILRQRAMAS